MKSCPQCRLLLEQTEWEGRTVWVCRSCGGGWFTASEFAAAITAGRDRFAELNRLFPGVASTALYEGLRFFCPDCKLAPLEIAPLPQASDVAAMRCQKCEGVWLRPADRAALAGEAPPEPSILSAASFTSVWTPSAAPVEPVEATAATPEIAEAEAPAAVAPSPPITEPLTDADRILQDLLEGNRRFVEGKSLHPHQTAMRRAEIAQAQNPCAVIIGCSDSRVPPETILDQGLGDLFVVRNAGCVLSKTALESVEFAVDLLQAPLIMVLGHARCGAVQAAVEGQSAHPDLHHLIDSILPAVEKARRQPGELLENAVKMNVRMLAGRLRESLGEKVAAGAVRVVEAYYNLDSGRVEILPEEEASPVDMKRPATPSPAEAAQTPEKTVEIGHVAAPEPKPLVEAPSTGEERADTLRQLSAALARWCPQCRRGYSQQEVFCRNCGVALVESFFRVPCLQCRQEHPISAERCWSCKADLHPVWLTGSHGASKPPPSIDEWLTRLPRHPSPPGSSCSSSVLVLASLGVLLTAIAFVFVFCHTLLRSINAP